MRQAKNAIVLISKTMSLLFKAMLVIVASVSLYNLNIFTNYAGTIFLAMAALVLVLRVVYLKYLR